MKTINSQTMIALQTAYNDGHMTQDQFLKAIQLLAK